MEKKMTGTTAEGWGPEDDGTMSTITATYRTPAVAVCCGSVIGGKRRGKWKKALKKTMFWRRRNKYFDAEVGAVEEWDGDEIELKRGDSESSFAYYYFDAHEDPLSDYDCPLLLGEQSARGIKRMKDIDESTPSLDDTSSSSTPRKKTSSPLPGSTSSSTGELTPETATIEQLLQELRSPTVKTKMSGAPGYPGGFTPEQMEQCEIFLYGLEKCKKTTPRIYEQVYSYIDVEDMATTISRCVRATKFDAQAMLDRLVENQAQFERAKDCNFFPDIDGAIGAPFSVFLSQYPFVGVGKSRDCFPVNYFQAGNINPEGIMALTTVDQLEGYYWWSFHHKFREDLRSARGHPKEGTSHGFLCEAVTVIDLQGLSASALSSDTMDVIKLSSKIADFYPETLHKMFIINAPGFFSFSWGLIKKFIDPQTAGRIQIFSNAKKALHAMEQLIDIDQIPSDYGGTNTCIRDALLAQSNDPLLLRQEIELLHVKRKHKSHSKQHWELMAGERIDISAFSRSASAARITLKVNGNATQSVEAWCGLKNEVIQSKETKIDTHELVGPCTLTLDIEDLDTADKQHHKESHGYFLVVGDVKKVVY